MARRKYVAPHYFLGGKLTEPISREFSSKNMQDGGHISLENIIRAGIWKGLNRFHGQNT